jgi:hypothetical protein
MMKGFSDQACGNASLIFSIISENSTYLAYLLITRIIFCVKNKMQNAF